MYLQKYVQYYSGDFLGQNEEGNLCRGSLVLMINCKKSIPFVMRYFPETKLTGEGLKYENNKYIFDLMEVEFKVRAVITDDSYYRWQSFDYECVLKVAQYL